MCTEAVRKEANRLNWIIKGKLIDMSWSDEEIEKTYHSYFKRLWGNNESYLHEDGFEWAWEERFQRERELVANLGYD